MRFPLYVICIALIASCSSARWYSIEQEPAKPIAYISGGVFVVGEYVRSASIVEIDGNKLSEDMGNSIQIPIGTRTIKILCDEAKGNYDSSKFTGESKKLQFIARTEKNYRAGCMPFTHWWIEEIATNNIVAGIKPDKIK